MHPNVCSTLLTTASTWKQPRCPLTDEWIKKYICAMVHIHKGISLSHKKEQMWLGWTEVDEPRAYYTEWSKSEREKQILCINVGQLGDQTRQSKRKSTLNIHWKGRCWSWSSNTLAPWCKQLIHWKRPWCWEGLKAAEGDNRGWDGWMATILNEVTKLAKILKTESDFQGKKGKFQFGKIKRLWKWMVYNSVNVFNVTERYT